MKKQKNIFQLERENELLKQNLITSELSKININDSIILNFSENTSYFEKIAELINLYEIDSYLIYFIIKPKLEEKLDIFELSNDIKTILSLTIQPFSPIFKVDSDIFIFAFAFSNSEIKAKLNLFLYQLNQSILSSILDVEIIVFSILNCLEKIETNINIVEHFNNKLK